MSNWKISKSMNFSYGHRVHTQNLIEEYSCDTSCKCKWLHGHNADVTVYFEADKLERGFVTDFKHANWINKFLDTYVDHKFILDLNDPWFNQIINGTISGQMELISGIPTGRHTRMDSLQLPRVDGEVRYVPIIPVYVPGTDIIVAHVLDVNVSCGLGKEIYLDGPEKEFYEGFILVDFVPTSEYLSKWIYDFVDVKMAKIGIKVTQVDFSETPKTMATYVG
jgi:6-pyruvoyltetrahydropterin/6-carboxytetrahydropterin synthase